MSWFSNILSVAAPVAGAALGGPFGAVAGAALGAGASALGNKSKEKTSSSSNTWSSYGQSLLQDTIGAGINYQFNKAGADYSNKLAQQNAQYWANYNSPINQMQRLKEAGLNPNLVYGNGTVANTYDGAPNAPQIHGINTKFMRGVEAQALQQEIANKKLGGENIAKQNKLLDAQINKTDAEAEWQNIQNTIEKNKNPEAYGKLLYDLKESELKNQNEQYFNIIASRYGQEVANEISEQSLEIAKINAQWQKDFGSSALTVEYEKNLIQRVLLGFEAKFAPLLKQSQLNLNSAQVSTLRKQVGLMAAQISNYVALNKKLSAETDLTKKTALKTQMETLLTGLKSLEQSYRAYIRSYGLNPDGQLAQPLSLLLGVTDNGITQFGGKGANQYNVDNVINMLNQFNGN